MLTAGIAAPAALACAIAGGAWFLALVLGVALLAAAEVALLLPESYPLSPGAGERVRGLPGSRVARVAVAWLAAAAFPISVASGRAEVAWWLLGAATVGGLGFVVWTEGGGPAPLTPPQSLGAGLRRGSVAPLTRWALSLAGGLCIGTLLAPAIALRDRPDGLAWVALILAGTWTCDSLAYAVGGRWGRHHFASAISPHKSLEGVAGGVLACVAVVGLGAGLLGGPVPRAVGLGLVVGVASVLGDLAESSLKRAFGAKDSGWIMPGHGGMLDRIDSLLFSSFLGYLYITATDGMTQG